MAIRWPPSCRRARVAIAAGIAFFGFAIWTLRGEHILAVGVAFLLAELGDKTMLATVTLATHEDALGTWLGSTAGIVAADALAIAVGRILGTRLPERVVRLGAAAAFVIFGVLLVAGGISG